MSSEIPIIPAQPGFDKAKTLFVLRDPDPATDEAWDLYTSNRLEAPQLCDLVDDFDEEDIDRFVPESDIFYTIGRAMIALETKLGLQENVLKTSYRMLDCNLSIENAYGDYNGIELECLNPEFLTVMTRIYSPKRPLYIDVHLDYKTLFEEEGVGFHYSVGFKIHTFPAKDDYESTKPWKLRQEATGEGYTANGWRPIAYGHNVPGGVSYSFGRKGEGISNVSCLNTEDIKNIYDALWGPQEAIPDDADEERKIKCRRELVNGVCVLFAAIGIRCEIACMDSEKDFFGYWQVARVRSWLAKEVRNACGFQLKRDRGQVSQDEELPGLIIDEPDYYSDDFRY